MKTPTLVQKTQALVSAPKRKTFQEFQSDNRKKVLQWMREEEEDQEEYRQEDERLNFQRS